MATGPSRLVLASALVLAWAGGVSAQYRRQVEELPAAFGVSASLGALLSYEETVSPIETPLPDEERRSVRSVDAMPALSVAARYGRGIAVYGTVTLGLRGDADLSGTSPSTGEPLAGTEDTGLVTIASLGLSFVPVRDLMGLRLELGPAWLDLGDGGSYLGLRVAGSARFLELGDRGGVVLAWDGHFAGGQDDQADLEYQIRGGIVSALRLGFELEY